MRTARPSSALGRGRTKLLLADVITAERSSPRSISSDLSPVFRLLQPSDSPHGGPIVFVCRPADDAYLIIPPMNAMRPGESVRAQLLKEEGKKFACHVSRLRACTSFNAPDRGHQRRSLRFLISCGDISTEHLSGGSHRSPIRSGIMANAVFQKPSQLAPRGSA